ncbi:MAG: shikimate dehydrogenase [Chloroflexota bacterium]|nr:shikimate dehydrogenase [Chloroflexota bacterium]MDE2908910.1 shikimate dehydrogenase [Chloroflexota bacterium]
MPTNRVGVIGFPVEHSLSPIMHNAAFRALNMRDWHYDAMSIPPDILRLGLREPRDHGYIGINVTVPHKEAIMEFVRPDETARAIGAVNTVDFRSNIGANTDADGFINDLRAHDVKVAGERVLVLGAGGAARAAVYGLNRAGAEVAIVNRTKSRAEALIEHLRVSAGIGGIRLMTLDQAFEWGMSLIVNCTSAGLHPHVNQSPWRQSLPFPTGVTVYDMVYRPATTALMRQCAAHGGRAIGGLGMLARQGAIAFELWTGVAPPIDLMQRVLQNALAGPVQ